MFRTLNEKKQTTGLFVDYTYVYVRIYVCVQQMELNNLSGLD